MSEMATKAHVLSGIVRQRAIILWKYSKRHVL